MAENSDDKKKKKKISLSFVWQQARDLLWARRYRMLLGLLLLAISRGASMVLPGSTKFLIDNVIGQQQTELLLPMAGLFAAASVVQALSGFGLAMLLSIPAQRTVTDLRRRVQRHVEQLPVRYFDDHKTGEMISRVMSDAEGIRNLVGTGFVQLIGGFFTAAVALSVLFWINWRLTSLTLVTLGLFAGMMTVAFKKLRPLFRERNELNAQVTGRLTEALGGIRVVKAYQAEKREEIVFAKGAHRLLRNIIKSIVAVSGVNAVSAILFGITATLILVFGAREVMAGVMTVGDLFMYGAFTMMLVTPMVQISAIGTEITQAFAGLDRIQEVLEEPTEMDGEAERARLRGVQGDITFEDVGFEYVEDKPVLRGVSFNAPAGSTTALVGPSGSGKSTVISLVMAFNRPKSGCILVDGLDLGSVRLADFRSHLGVVLQESFLFDGTIAENIAYGNPNAAREQVLEAARIAHCDDFVSEFEDGYETVIGERGVKLSGGQRQRLSIARAILADPKILILDEATSSLDSESEEKIQDGLDTLRQGRTTFVIAHRLSTIYNADQILVLDDGEIVERGSHQELLDANGRYKQLHDKQFRLERNRYVNPGEDFTPAKKKEPVPAGGRKGGGLRMA